jgi:hypothetical protein
MWPRRGRRAGEGRLDRPEQPRERVGLGRGQVGEERREGFAERGLGRAQRPFPGGREHEGLAAPVVGEPAAPDEPGGLEPGEELRDRRGGHGRTACELGPDDLALADGAEGEELRDRERRLVRGEQPLDPAADERSRARQRIRRLEPASTRVWHQLRVVNG